MDIQRFRHIVVVAEEGNFARAAARLGMAQPPLSQSIQRSERDLGVTLFKRTRKGVYLTAAGQALLPEARAAVAAAVRAAELARAAVSRHPVRIGVASPCLWGPLPDLLRFAHKAGIDIEVIEASTNEQLQALAHGRLDLGFLSPPFDAPARLHVIDVSTDPLIAAVPKNLVAGRDAVPLSLLADRLILFPQQHGPSLHSKILHQRFIDPFIQWNNGCGIAFKNFIRKSIYLVNCHVPVFSLRKTNAGETNMTIADGRISYVSVDKTIRTHVFFFRS